MNHTNMPEKIIHTESCRTSLFFFWLTANFKLTNKRLQIKTYNTFLGCLPIGHSSENISYRNISSVKSSSKLHVLKFFIGGWLFLGSFRLMQSSAFLNLGVIELIIGFLFLLHSYKSTLKIVNNSGRTTNIEVFFLEGKKINVISRELNNQIIN